MNEVCEARPMIGNEAIARGAWEAGVKVAAAYPGTPSTEILEYMGSYPSEDLHAQWSTNEKVACDVAIGASFEFRVPAARGSARPPAAMAATAAATAPACSICRSSRCGCARRGAARSAREARPSSRRFAAGRASGRR